MTEQMNLFGDTAGAESTEPALSHEQAAARAAELCGDEVAVHGSIMEVDE